jgi:hypothetical protein
VAASQRNLAPYILTVGYVKEGTQNFLVVDQQVIMEVKTSDIPLVLMSAFFIFNIHYPQGCTNLYSFMEVFALGFSSAKASPTVKHVMACLKS